MGTEATLDPIEIAGRVAQLFERSGASYFIGGSIASSLLGEHRYTNDIDFVADLSSSQLASFLRQLGEEYYVSEDAARRAAVAGGSFNLIHIPSVQKIDVFIPEQSPFAREQMERRRPVNLRAGVRLYIGSPEDIVLSKLIWFKKGGGVSDRQWSDVLGVLKVQREKINLEYMKRWALPLQVDELLRRALDEAKP